MSAQPYDSYDNPNTILIRETDGIEFETKNAAAAIDPGDLLESAGGEYQPHSTDAGTAQPRFALENDAWGKTIDDPIVVGESCTGAYGKSGTGFYAWLGAGETVADDDVALVSDGTGALRPLDTVGGDTADAVVAYSQESVDNSGGVEKARIRVRT